MRCNHKWIVLQQTIKAGFVVAETCRCEKCGTIRREVEAQPAALSRG